MEQEKNIRIHGMDITEGGYHFASSIDEALSDSEIDLTILTDKINENYFLIQKLTPECDMIDYISAVSSGTLCGLLDIFSVGKPGESPLGDKTDKMTENCTKVFARWCGWKDDGTKGASSAIKFLEEKFKVPYDQRGAGDAGGDIFDLNPKNHHFKSLGHNPTLLGLFFSVLDQFQNTSHFISDGELISLEEADSGFKLQGNDPVSKLFCGVINWFGHLMSDISGSSSSKGRGMGIPSPIWCLSNDIIAIKRKLNIPVLEFDKRFNELALEIYNKGYDIRFQATQAIPVIINELLVRTMYSVRRLVRYFQTLDKTEYSFKQMWLACEPFSNASVKRMLTVAHGTLCAIDIGDAVFQGATSGAGSFNVVESILRFNIIAFGRFAISLYGEGDRALKRYKLKDETYRMEREQDILAYYVDGLRNLSELYDDASLLTFVDNLQSSDSYKQAFNQTVLLAEKRMVDDQKILRNKSDIDAYFKGDIQ